MGPQRIQLRRTKGWRKPEGAVVVARPTKWGNPWRIGEPSPHGDGEPLTAAGAVAMYRETIADLAYCLGDPLWNPDPGFAESVRRELAGHDLACWCPLGQPCHADVLLEIANGGVE